MSPTSSTGESKANCDHIVGHEYDGEDLGEVFYRVSNFKTDYGIRPSIPFMGERAFKFCPLCGTSLAEFWGANKKWSE